MQKICPEKQNDKGNKIKSRIMKKKVTEIWSLNYQETNETTEEETSLFLRCKMFLRRGTGTWVRVIFIFIKFYNISEK